MHLGHLSRLNTRRCYPINTEQPDGVAAIGTPQSEKVDESEQ